MYCWRICSFLGLTRAHAPAEMYVVMRLSILLVEVYRMCARKNT
jgi:hypothetical protein